LSAKYKNICVLCSISVAFDIIMVESPFIIKFSLVQLFVYLFTCRLNSQKANYKVSTGQEKRNDEMK